MASSNRLNPIPHPPKKPVVGNMLSLDPNAPVQHLVRLTKELGPIFWLDMMGAPLVIVWPVPVTLYHTPGAVMDVTQNGGAGFSFVAPIVDPLVIDGTANGTALAQVSFPGAPSPQASNAVAPPWDASHALSWAVLPT